MSKPKVIFVDDEERIVRSLAVQFRSTHTVKTCIDPYDAINLLKQEHFHVVVSDQRMPKMQGVELLRQTRELSPNSLGILLTGYADLPAITGAINDGEIFRYITKPWDRDELARIMETATEIALQMEQHSVAAAAKSSCSQHIIVIDDDQEIHSTISHQFQDRSSVHWASSLVRAFELFDEHDISLIITDVKLQGEDITPALKALKQCNPKVISIVLTDAQDSELLISLINQAQVFRYLPKPIHSTLLNKSVEAALGLHEKLCHSPELAKRHIVEKPAQEHVVSNSIMGFLQRIKERFAPTVLQFSVL